MWAKYVVKVFQLYWILSLCLCIQQPGTQMWIPEMHKIPFHLGIFNTIAEHTIILNGRGVKFLSKCN